MTFHLKKKELYEYIKFKEIYEFTQSFHYGQNVIQGQILSRILKELFSLD